MRSRTGLLSHQWGAALGGVAAVVYAWWATGIAPFTALSYIVIALPCLALVVTYGAAGGLTSRRPEIAEYYRRHRASGSPAPWFAILAVAIVLESTGLMLGGRSPTFPTLSTTVDYLLATHWERFLLCAAWLSVGWYPVAHLATRGRRWTE
ncbi:MAG: hypothetical protein ACYDGN_11660 [Acidimicrobiales bacterium]